MHPPPSLLNSIRSDMLRWQETTVLWFGRAASLKMNVLPRLLYVLQNVPVLFPRSFFASLRKLFTDYIWKDKPPRMILNTFSLPRRKGGISLPHIEVAPRGQETFLKTRNSWTVATWTSRRAHNVCRGGHTFRSAIS